MGRWGVGHLLFFENISGLSLTLWHIPELQKSDDFYDNSPIKDDFS